MLIATIITGLFIAALGLDALTSAPRSADVKQENTDH